MFILRTAKVSAYLSCLAIFSAIAIGQSMSSIERKRILTEQDVKAAGNSGDKTFIPFLQDVVRERKYYRNEWDDVQMALAKLGDRQAQQEIVCVFYKGDNYEAQIAGGRQLPYVGGWFSIQLYTAMLTDEKIMLHWFKAAPKEPSDEIPLSPQSAALNYLPKLVPGLPPINEKDWKTTQRLWPEYIRQHETELKYLAPTGDGVDFSGNSCKGKPTERSIH